MKNQKHEEQVPEFVPAAPKPSSADEREAIFTRRGIVTELLRNFPGIPDEQAVTRIELVSARLTRHILGKRGE